MSYASLKPFNRSFPSASFSLPADKRASMIFIREQSGGMDWHELRSSYNAFILKALSLPSLICRHLFCERCLFAGRKDTFQPVFCALLQGEKPPFPKQVINARPPTVVQSGRTGIANVARLKYKSSIFRPATLSERGKKKHCFLPLQTGNHSIC